MGTRRPPAIELATGLAGARLPSHSPSACCANMPSQAGVEVVAPLTGACCVRSRSVTASVGNHPGAKVGRACTPDATDTTSIPRPSKLTMPSRSLKFHLRLPMPRRFWGSARTGPTNRMVKDRGIGPSRAPRKRLPFAAPIPRLRLDAKVKLSQVLWARWRAKGPSSGESKANLWPLARGGRYRCALRETIQGREPQTLVVSGVFGGINQRPFC
jgi:hypothetical protein